MIFLYWSLLRLSIAASAFLKSFVVALTSASIFLSFILKNFADTPGAAFSALKPFFIASSIFTSCSVFPSSLYFLISPSSVALMSLNFVPYFFALRILYSSRAFSCSACHCDRPLLLHYPYHLLQTLHPLLLS